MLIQGGEWCSGVSCQGSWNCRKYCLTRQGTAVCLFIHSFINGSLFVVSLRAPCFAGRLPEFNSRKQRVSFTKLVKQRCFGLLDMAAVLCLFFCLFNWPLLGCL
jgi:hypothetical protein